jgi:hypothetical protein
MKTKKRYILGVGYPWYSCRENEPACTAIILFKEKDGLGDTVLLTPGQTGAWKKYKLILEEV